MFPSNNCFFVRLLAALSVSSSIGGCSLAPVITSHSIDYNSTVEDVTNQSLVINILRGRDNAPLYFPDLSQIRGAVTATASAQATIPYGPTFGTTQTGPFSVSTAPTFDIAPTNTKQFYQGILNPISKEIFAYFIERDRAASDFAPTFNLMVNAVEDTRGSSRTIPWYSDEFAELTSSWFEGEDSAPVVVQAGSESVKLGPPVKADAKSLVDANTAGLTMKAEGDKVQLETKKPQPVICFKDKSGYFPVSIEDNSTVKPTSGDAIGKPPENQAKAVSACAKLNPFSRSVKTRTNLIRYKLHLRSVEQMFYYLGAIVKDEMRSTPKFGLPSGDLKGCPRLAFYIRDKADGNTRFAVPYRGETFYIDNDGASVPACGLDRSLPIIAILNDLLNLNRDANETPTTKATQSVGPT